MGKPTIYLEKAAELRLEIRRGDYASKPFPSEAQLMRKFGVGRQTAVRILETLRDEGLVVRRCGSGTFLSSVGRRATGRIGLIVHGSDYCEIFTPITKSISQLCQRNDYTLMLGDASSLCTADRVRRVTDIASKFIADGLDGVLFQPIELIENAERVNREITDLFTRADIPVVLLDSDIVSAPARSTYDLATVDHLAVGRTLAGFLRSVGARRIVYLTQENRAPCVRERQLGVKIGCEGLPVPGTAVYAEPDDVRAVRRLLTRHRPDAIACYNDRQAALLLQTLSGLKRRVPDDVMVAGFDDVQYARLTIPQLTTLRQPCGELAEAAFKLLLSRIRKPGMPPRKIVLTGELVVRGSTRQPVNHTQKETRI